MIVTDQHFNITRINRRLKNMIRLPVTGVVGRGLFGLLEEESGSLLSSLVQHEQFESTPEYLTLGFVLKDHSVWKVRSYLKRYRETDAGIHYCILLFNHEEPPESAVSDLQLQRHKIIVETQEEERMTIGSALHDNVAQLLYGIRLNLQYYIMQHGERELFVTIKKMLNDAIQQIRNISMELYPSALNEFGLAQSIRAMAGRFSLPGFQVLALVQGVVDHLPGNMQLAVYRIVQELLNNAMKHAGADKVLMRIAERKGKICIQVTDNGKGFGKNVTQCIADGTGLKNIRTRIKMFNGYMRIKTNQAKNQGTAVFIYLSPPN